MWWRLPAGSNRSEYQSPKDCTKRAASLSHKAVAVWDALQTARDPDRILFRELPLARAFDPFESQRMSERSVRTLFHEIDGAFAELQ